MRLAFCDSDLCRALIALAGMVKPGRSKSGLTVQVILAGCAVRWGYTVTAWTPKYVVVSSTTFRMWYSSLNTAEIVGKDVAIDITGSLPGQSLTFEEKAVHSANL